MSPIKFPLPILLPLQKHLKKEAQKLNKQKEELEAQDPFNDEERLSNNAAVDADAAEESGHDRITALKQEIDKTLIRVKKALTKIKLGRFGLCEKCGKLIDTDRLAVDPTATHCINCASKLTKK